MLQIATGKLFTRDPERENRLRGLLYTNAHFDREAALETAAGRLIPTSSYSIRPYVLIYEFIERIEKNERGPGILISSTVDPYLQDFSVVVSFALNCVCTPDVDSARRLINGRRGLATPEAPSKLVRRFFDEEFSCTPSDIAFAKAFVDRLIALPRSTFLGVMRALRTYVNGMHRIADDLELAYALLVASVESLAHDFDGYSSGWDAIDDRKRRALDQALSGADPGTAQRVRDALIKVEHLALGRRFREFVITHTPSSHFREASANADQRLAKSDLAEGLTLAYASRSAYIHQLRRLPDAVTLGYGHAETAVHGRATHLTLQGLSRLMRSAITDFVMRQPSVEKEPYDYHLERSGVVQMALAPHYWVGSTAGAFEGAGRIKLEGFLQQLEQWSLAYTNAQITDVRAVLMKASGLAPTMRQAHRRPYLALHFLFNYHAPEDARIPIPSSLEELMRTELDAVSSEGLIAHVLSDQRINWPEASHRQAFEQYLKERKSKNGIRFPRTYEAAIALDLAERYRSAGDVGACQMMIAFAVENHPGHGALLEFEKTWTVEKPITWRLILLPPPAGPASAAAP